VVLGVVVWRVGDGAVLDGLQALDVGVLVLGVLAAAVSTVACAWRWRLVARELGVPITLPGAVAACYRAQLLNTVLPGGVLGDVHRGVAHGRCTGETRRALWSVGWERFAGQAVQAAIAALALVLLPSPVRPGPMVGTVVVVVVVTLALVGLRSRPGVVVASVVALAGYTATYVLAARAVGVDEPLASLLPLVLLVLVAAGLPLNLAGWGPREGMAAWAFAAAGLGAGTGLATAVAYGTIVLVGNLPGVVVLLASRTPGVVVAPEGERVRA
jgi:hypothetical protein